MNTELPAPLVPAEVDLTGYEFMPLYGERLRSSDVNSRATDAEFRAALNLWWSAWKQIPAASLPDDDVVLCRLADLGRDLKAWRKVRAMAMANFTLCSDGRWYHTFLAPEALKAWESRLKARAKGIAGAAKRYGRNVDNSVGKPVGSLATASLSGSTGTATATRTGSTGTARTIEKPSKRQGQYSKSSISRGTTDALPVDNHERRMIDSTSTPIPSAHSCAMALQAISESRAAITSAVPPPPELMKRYAGKART